MSLPRLTSAELSARQAAMAVCAAATRDELSGILSGFPISEAATDVRPVEPGLVMLRGRVGGDGQPFNLGEASVTRACVSLANGTTGFAYMLGRDRDKARIAAIIDALWQGPDRSAVEESLEPIRARIREQAAIAARRVAATRVNFFTMVRGEDE